MIRQIFRIAALAALAGLLAGCGFESPLTSRPSKDLNTWLLGVWEHKNEKGEVIRATVTPKTGDRYWVTVQRPGKAGRAGKDATFEAYISRVGRSNFLTMRCLDGTPEIEEGSYAFVHYQVLDQNDVRIRIPFLEAGREATSYELRKEVRARIRDNTLYPDSGTDWTRISEVYWSTGDEPQPMQPLRFPEPPAIGETVP